MNGPMWTPGAAGFKGGDGADEQTMAAVKSVGAVSLVDGWMVRGEHKIGARHWASGYLRETMRLRIRGCLNPHERMEGERQTLRAQAAASEPEGRDRSGWLNWQNHS